ncbi:MAG TPA: hypothetical protein VH331_06165 [Allosphingosinicella sp.]|jgi:hypothetical protein|nr:hypothetical protein [Allosphingosinicella sp.]
MAKGGCRRAGLNEASLLALLAVPLAAACHRAPGDQPVLPADQLANAVEAVRVEHKVVPKPPKRLGFLLPGDLGRASGDILCTLAQNGRAMLVSGSKRALARVDGKPVLLDLGGPIGPSAAFFRAPGVTISLGRRDEVDPRAEPPGAAWPVGVTVGGLDDVEDEKIDATWACGISRPLRPGSR